MIIRTPRDVGAIIRERRRALGLDQAELAERVGVSRLWINQIERGKPGASLNLVLRALAAVGAELSTDIEDRPRKRPAPVVTPDIDAIVQAARRRDRKP
jgi:HTH-type transcriptional regulator/antitoxin HipB